MIQVKMHQNDKGVYTGFHVSGHAGYGAYGQDIVCAAVSALVVNTMNSVEQFTEDAFEGSIDEASGDVRFHFKDEPGVEAALFMKSLVLGLTGIQEQYGTEIIQFVK